nr:type II toxin-antitoxin system HicA family toxin [Leptospira weilii]
MSLKPLSYREVKRKLERFGFRKVSQKGSHVKFIKLTEFGTLTAIVDRNTKKLRLWDSTKHFKTNQNQLGRI